MDGYCFDSSPIRSNAFVQSDWKDAVFPPGYTTVAVGICDVVCTDEVFQ
jgi:hypothetical protein